MLVDAVVPNNLVDENTKYLFNPTGRFVIGGPARGFWFNRKKDYC